MPIEAKPLFRPDVLRTRLATFQLPAHVDAFRSRLTHWADLLGSGRADALKEQELLPDFLTDFFVTLLGYTRPADGANGYTISRERHVEVNGEFADAVLGEFGRDHDQFVVAVEGKGPKDPLDRPYAGRRKSAVEQGYLYAINLPCDWIIVTSIRQTRLYHKGADSRTYERFDTEELADSDSALHRFVFLLGAERVVPEAGRCHFYELLTESTRVGRDLTKGFYLRYADMRQDAFEQLACDNPQVSRHQVLTGTQKLLDRILFCAFCEDRGLLPTETIRQAYAHRDPYHPRPIWDNFRGLFGAVNRGNAALGIHPYNGGLFAEDPVLDALVVSDEVCGYFRELGEYDYRPAHQAAAYAPTNGQATLIDVDILGHIFEQSITDLERLRNELDGLVEPQSKEKHKTRRKKEGAFYTPAFITRYIIEQALGGALRDRFERLRQRHQHAAKGNAAAALDNPNLYILDKLKKPERAALVRFWEAWQDELASVRILDPACGSGAFLIEAFDQLHATYQLSNDRLQELRGHRSLFDLDKRILENNLYGVDLNEEAIEICRLSLWIKTAERGKALTSLDHPIRVGNSVVTDPAVHPKAFDWQTAFPEVFKAGGFDVVVANPPYIRQEWLAPYKPHWEANFRAYYSTADIFAYFYERGLELLCDGGRLALITSGSWVRGNFGAPLRKYLAENATIESMIDFGEFQPFEDAEMIRPTIAVLKKQPAGAPMRLFKWLVTGRPPENLSEVIATAPTMRTDDLGADAWELESDDVLALRKKLATGHPTLRAYTSGSIFYGIKTGLSEIYILDEATRSRLLAEDPNTAELLEPFVQGTNMREWYVEPAERYLLAIKSSSDFDWPWSQRGTDAEEVFRETYPAAYDYLQSHRSRVTKRSDQGRQWWELRTCSYWDRFAGPKIVWPDITNRPRFALDREGLLFGDTAFMVPTDDYYLLGVLASWITWFFLSKTAQPLRLRSDRWQYRLKAQYMENVPVPDAAPGDRQCIATLAERCCALATERHKLQTSVQHRLLTFSEHGTLNQKAQAWWELSFHELGSALKTSFKLKQSPFKNPRVADEWEPYIDEKRAEVARLTKEISESETELNDRVFRLFSLTSEEIRLLQKEVEH